MRKEEARAPIARFVLHQLARIAERIGHLVGDAELEGERLSDSIQYCLLGVRIGDIRVIEQAHNRKSGVRRMEEGTVFVVRAPVVLIFAAADQARHQAFRPAICCFFVDRLLVCFEEFGGG